MLVVDSIGKSGGLVVLWKEDVNFAAINYSSHHNHGVVGSNREGDNRWWLIRVYGHLEASH